MNITVVGSKLHQNNIVHQAKSSRMKKLVHLNASAEVHGVISKQVSSGPTVYAMCDV